MGTTRKPQTPFDFRAHRHTEDVHQLLAIIDSLVAYFPNITPVINTLNLDNQITTHIYPWGSGHSGSCNMIRYPTSQHDYFPQCTCRVIYVKRVEK